MSRIARRNIVPVNQITPLTYRDGVTYIQMLNELSEYVKSILHPSLQHTVDQLVADVEAQMDKHHDQYVDGVQEFQRIHDAFMSDVNAHLIALSDGATADLVKDDTSLLSQTLREVFATSQDVSDVASTVENLNDRVALQFNTTNTRLDDVEESLSQDDPSDTSKHYETHSQWGVVDEKTLVQAIENIPEHSILTLPPDLIIDVTPGRPIHIDRDNIGIRGGTYRGDQGVFHVSGDGVSLEDMVITDKHTLDDSQTQNTYTVRFTSPSTMKREYISARIRNLNITGATTAIRLSRVKNFRVTDCTIRDFVYGGITMYQAHDGYVAHNHISDGRSNQSVNWNCYGISTSNRKDDPLDYRCHNIDIVFNTVSNIPDWEAIDTHSGVNHNISFNTVRGCRRSIALVSHMDAPNSGVHNARVIGNMVDNTGHSRDHFNDDIGITFQGHATRKGNAVITGNTILNAEYPVRFLDDEPERYDYWACKVFGNSHNLIRYATEGTETDSGWVFHTNYVVHRFGSRQSDADPLKARLVKTNTSWALYIRGAVHRDTTNSGVFELKHKYHSMLIPPAGAFGTKQRIIIGRAYKVVDTSVTSPVFLTRDGFIHIGEDRVSGSYFVDIEMRN